MNISKNKYQPIKRVLYFFILFFTLLFSISENRSDLQSKEKADSGSLKTVMRALYVPNNHSRNMDYIKTILEKGKPLGINMLVLDVHTYGSTVFKADKKVLEYLKSENIYRVARVVCFQDGLNQITIPEARMKALHTLVGEAADAGFEEVQLDYIRFQDGGIAFPLKKKYAFIEELLKSFRKITDERKVKLSADLFGRIVYNQNDMIGQKMEVFMPHTDVLYPMLYPSHYTGDRQRMSNPGETVKEGTLKGLKRVEGTNVAIQPWIQAFPYNIQPAKVKLDQYVALQIKGVEETGARGWVAWNPNGDYSSVFSALSIIAGEVITKKE
ncbi:MAG: hypothetical protein CVV49_09750 [Spirochaetae bacterium HGW-Spirochaetae-5]|nr:MAG: hypothetical protein CVV49_09750 [Spirochaetae bacterium HGW-Spirochaetae-5]